MALFTQKSIKKFNFCIQKTNYVKEKNVKISNMPLFTSIKKCYLYKRKKEKKMLNKRG